MPTTTDNSASSIGRDLRRHISAPVALNDLECSWRTDDGALFLIRVDRRLELRRLHARHEKAVRTAVAAK
jgi:hypothetical protein